MSAFIFTANASTTLSAAISSTSSTSLTVASSTGFPVPVSGTTQFQILIDAEIINVTAISGTTWTIARGQDGTTAATHSSGAAVTHIVGPGALGILGGDGQSYTPSWTAATTNPVINNGTITGQWYYINTHLVYFSATVTMGSSTTYGTGIWSLSLPVTAARIQSCGTMRLTQGSTNQSGTGAIISGALGAIRLQYATGSVNSTNPYTWANGDQFYISGVYEV